ncbi:MAG: hypothetical protein AAGH78_03250 [Cyanobacteria bacterium P01_H01_bin.58]
MSLFKISPLLLSLERNVPKFKLHEFASGATTFYGYSGKDTGF